MQSSEGAVASAAAANPAAVKVARKESQQSKHKHSIRYPFWFGGSASSMAACMTHPLDLGTLCAFSFTSAQRLGLTFILFRCPVVKVRLQMRTPEMPSSMVGTIRYIISNNGFLGLYAGLSASLLRQITYSTTRFGIYEELKTLLTKKNEGKPPSFPVLVALSCTSGFIGGISGNAGKAFCEALRPAAGVGGGCILFERC